MSDPRSDGVDSADGTDGYASIADLDDAVAAGRISFDRYWTVRAAIDARADRQREEHAYDPAPVLSTTPSRPDVRWASPPIDHHLPAGFVPPPPRSIRPVDPPASPLPLIAPPPATDGQSSGPVTLPMNTPSTEAGATRADDRRRRRRR